MWDKMVGSFGVLLLFPDCLKRVETVHSASSAHRSVVLIFIYYMCIYRARVSGSADTKARRLPVRAGTCWGITAACSEDVAA